MRGLGFIKTAAAAGVLALSMAASGAMASTVHPCTVQSVTTANDPADNAAAAACEGIFSQTGQPSQAQMIAALNTAASSVSLSLPGKWVELGKIDDDALTNAHFSITGLGNTTGTWKITNPVPGYVYGIVMKGANQWGAWIPTTPIWEGNWWTDPDIKVSGPSGNIAGLSNFTVFAAIPLPAAGWLLLGGLGALGAVARRKRRKAA